MESTTRLNLLEEYGRQLARLHYHRGQSYSPAIEGRVREIRVLLKRDHARSDPADPLARMFESLDHVFRVVLLRPTNAPFSVQSCAGADVEYYRVVIDEDGEIRNATRLTNQASAIETAENWYYLVAGIGLTVTLLAVLESGQIIKCGARKVT